MKTAHVVIVAAAVVLVVMAIALACTSYARQNTERRSECIQAGGTWIESSCVAPIRAAVG